MTESDDEGAQWIADLGITDRSSAIEKANDSRAQL